MSPKTPLSVAIITKNEEANIARCLASVDFAAEVVIVDSDSTDRTVEIARDMGARVIEHEWLGFGPQKQLAVDHCTHPWVLILDADEVIPPETAAAIDAAVNAPEAEAYILPRANFLGKKEIRHGSWRGDAVLRLFRKDTFRVSPHQVHEEVCGEGRIARLKSPIHHFPRKSLADFLTKADKYAGPGAAQMFAAGRRGSIAAAVLHAFWVFFFNYFFRLGFLDGNWGIVIAFSDMVGTFFKYAILWDLEKNQPSKGMR